MCIVHDYGCLYGLFLQLLTMFFERPRSDIKRSRNRCAERYQMGPGKRPEIFRSLFCTLTIIVPQSFTIFFNFTSHVRFLQAPVSNQEEFISFEDFLLLVFFPFAFMFSNPRRVSRVNSRVFFNISHIEMEPT